MGSILWAALAALVLCNQSFASEWSAHERTLRRLERDMLAAYAMLDFQTLTNIYADDFTYISNDGSTMTKARVVEMVRTAAFRVDSITVSDSRLRLYGTTAIITGIRRFFRAGKMLAEARYTEVWLNRNKRWQCVSGQLTPILDKK